MEYPVVLHIYELGNEASMLLSTLGAGGIYHTGVEIGGKEYAFGDTSGVWTAPVKLPESLDQVHRIAAPVLWLFRDRVAARIVSDLSASFPRRATSSNVQLQPL